MIILNVMFGRNRGGLEQVAIDYHGAFESRGHQVTSVVHPDSWAKSVFDELTSNTCSLRNMGEWDLIAARKLRRIIRQNTPDIIICHGNRAIRLVLKAKGHTPIVAVAHNYNNKHFNKCDAVFCITKHLVSHIQSLGISQNNVFHVPNMIDVPPLRKRPELSDIPVIGTLGRFVEKKGFDILITALSNLKKKQIAFRAVLGGDGPLQKELQNLVSQCDLRNELVFLGWVEDKVKFFDEIDLFVLPSRHEPFGLVLIEAMSNSVPCISTASEGPSEIITDGVDGLLVDLDEPDSLASAVEQILKNPQRLQALGKHGYQTVCEEYSTTVVSEILERSTIAVINRH